jgi:EmrB/QacA subfamily drug resistance transporter
MHMLAAAPTELSRRDRILAFAAAMLVLLLSALDQTIVATAMPRIVADLSGLERIAWVGTAYLLTSTVVVPIYGKLGDLYGRRAILIFGVIVFLIGSALCGLAGEFGTLPLLGDGMNQLIIFRALQGIGGGALATGAFATVADLVPPAERGRYTGLFGAVFGLASVLGPLVGGLLTDHASMTIAGHYVSGWRFVFYVNLPLGAVALYVLATHLPHIGVRRAGRIDWLGSVLILVAFVPLLLALSWGGHRFAWDSPMLLAMFGAAIAGLVALYFAERGNPDAVIPIDLFSNRVFARGNAALFLINMAFMGIVMFYPLYLQVVKGVAATTSGFAMLPMMGGILVASMIGGRLSSRYQVYKPILVGGSVLMLIGVGLLLTVDRDTPLSTLGWFMAVLGLGMGPAQGMYTLAIQSTVAPARTGVATASAQFFRQIGSTVGVALFGALLTNSLTADLPMRVPEIAPIVAQGSSAEPVDISRAQTLAMDEKVLRSEMAAQGRGDDATVARVKDELRDSFAAAILALFRVSAGLMALAFLVTLTVPGLKLRGRQLPTPPADDA